MMEYLILVLVVFIIAFYIDTKYRIHLHRNVHVLLAFIIILILLIFFFDDIAIRQGWWSFPKPETYIGYVGIIPLEEFLYTAAVAYLSIVVWRYLRKKSP